MTDELKARSLRFSFFDGIFASTMMGFTQDYFAPFLLLINGTSRHIGFLSSLPNLFSALFQLKSPDLTEKCGSRKSVITGFVLFQAVLLVPIILMAFGKINSPWLFIGCVTVFSALGAFSIPPWGSLMSDLVEEKKRGEYFGRRNRNLGYIMVLMSFAAGLTLHLMQGINIFYGFALIFFGAMLSRLLSWYFLTKMHEPALEHKQTDYFNFMMFIRRTKESNFAKFVLFVAMLNFCVNIASPFFAVFMLRDLNFDYLTYTIITITATLSVYLLISRWGIHADAIGNLQIMRFTAPLIAILPLFWIVNQDPVFLFFAQLVSGFAWAGFNLCASNFIYDAVTPAKRTRCIAYFNAINGTALCLGGLVGGFLCEKLPTFFGYQLLTLFLLSSCLRLGVAIVMPLFIKEVRPVAVMANRNLFLSMIGLKPMFYDTK